MILDHQAILKAYPECVEVHDSKGAFDKDGKSISLEQSKIDAARTTLDAEAAAVKYKTDRTTVVLLFTLLSEINLICCMQICLQVN